MELLHLRVEEGLCIQRERLAVGCALHVAAYIIEDMAFPALIDPLRPGHRHEDDKGKKRDPDNDGLAEVSRLVLPDDAVEIKQAENRPDRHEGICLRRDGVIREDARDREEHHEDHQDDQTD